MQAYQVQIFLSVNITPMTHYIVYHNVTSDYDQGIIAYDSSVTIHVPNDNFEANAVCSIQVAAVNVIGQGPASEITLSEFNFELLVERKFPLDIYTSYSVTFFQPHAES